MCPRCAHRLRRGARFCPRCGVPLARVCLACGQESLNPQARFCSRCGRSNLRRQWGGQEAEQDHRA